MKRKMIVLGKKKLIWTAIMLFGVMLPLMVVSYNVPVGPVAVESTKMLDYNSEAEKISFSYPQGWLLRTEKYSSGDVRENISFWNSDGKASGFVQVMEIAVTIPEYVLAAKEKMVQGFDSFNFGPKTIGNKSGYMLAYMRGTGEARSVAAEYFFKSGKKVYRFSCFYPEIEAEKYTKVFTEMLNSFTFPEEAALPEKSQDKAQQNKAQQDKTQEDKKVPQQEKKAPQQEKKPQNSNNKTQEKQQ